MPRVLNLEHGIVGGGQKKSMGSWMARKYIKIMEVF
jgi:hypothetical protein